MTSAMDLGDDHTSYFRRSLYDAAQVIQEADDINLAIGAAPHPGRAPDPRGLPGAGRRDDGTDREGPSKRDQQRRRIDHHDRRIRRGDPTNRPGTIRRGIGGCPEASANTEPFSSLPLPDVVEAAVRSNKPDVARTAPQRLSTVARASGTQWVLGIDARSQALVCEDRHEWERRSRYSRVAG
jgi:hypothetical protein